MRQQHTRHTAPCEPSELSRFTACLQGLCRQHTLLLACWGQQTGPQLQAQQRPLACLPLLLQPQALPCCLLQHHPQQLLLLLLLPRGCGTPQKRQQSQQQAEKVAATPLLLLLEPQGQQPLGRLLACSAEQRAET
jgi:hypothetical protein